MGGFVDFGELKFEFGGVELGTVYVCWDLEELVVADCDDMLRFVGWVGNWIIGWFGWNARGVEHVSVAGHCHWLLAHIFWFEGASNDLFLEFEGGSCDSSSSFGWVSAFSVISEGVEVGDIGNDRISRSEISGFVPPVYYPALMFWIFCSFY